MALNARNSKSQFQQELGLNYNYDAASPKFQNENDYILKKDSVEQFDNRDLQRNMMAGIKSTISGSQSAHGSSFNNHRLSDFDSKPVSSKKISMYEKEMHTFRKPDQLMSVFSHQQRSLSQENTLMKKMSPPKPKVVYRNNDLSSVRQNSSFHYNDSVGSEKNQYGLKRSKTVGYNPLRNRGRAADFQYRAIAMQDAAQRMQSSRFSTSSLKQKRVKPYRLLSKKSKKSFKKSRSRSPFNTTKKNVVSILRNRNILEVRNLKMAKAPDVPMKYKPYMDKTTQLKMEIKALKTQLNNLK